VLVAVGVVDSDGDGVSDDIDECPGTPAGAIVDSRGCTINLVDADGDGVSDDIDECPETPAGAIVNSHGCSIEQLVPCAGPRSGGHWKNHGQYVSTLTKTAKAFLRERLITPKQAGAIVSAGARSSCGKKVKIAHKAKH
jgi:hypothetical protein